MRRFIPQRLVRYLCRKRGHRQRQYRHWIPDGTHLVEVVVDTCRCGDDQAAYRGRRVQAPRPR